MPRSKWSFEHPCPPIVPKFAPLHGDGRHYVAHIGIGLERLAAAEIARDLNATPVVVLQGCAASSSPFAAAQPTSARESLTSGIACRMSGG
jgi:hypothetical protein